MEYNYNIEADSIVLRIKHNIKIEAFHDIINYLNNIDESFGSILFKNVDLSVCYNNLLDDVHKKFHYSDCETMLYLGILESSTFGKTIEFKLIEDNEHILIELERNLKIENLLNE